MLNLAAKGQDADTFQYHVIDAIIGQMRRPQIDSIAITSTIGNRFESFLCMSALSNTPLSTNRRLPPFALLIVMTF